VNGSHDALIGTVLDRRYRIEQCLDTGGIGAVYRGEDLKLGRPVAIKVMLRKHGASEELRLRFEREAQALAAVAHPAVVPISDYGFADGLPYLVMEYLDGQTLRELLDVEGAIAPDRALTIIRQVLKALAYAHGRGLVHRDMKPGNVFVQRFDSNEEHVRLLDFGFAKFLRPEYGNPGPDLTRVGIAMGTPAYMAPEQASSRATDARTDIYAVGVLLFEMVTGHKPFEGEPPDLLRKHLTEPLPMLSRAHLGAYAAPLNEVIQHATAKKPRERFPDGSHMLAALDRTREVCDAISRGDMSHRPMSWFPWAMAAGGIMLGLVATIISLAVLFMVRQ
jgi:serine/threonine-protein kinase